ncbi:MAG: DJ-1/PfpI family protein [Firmicutes bacterium]|nr:DJ-1/PfpI family protein [Bacillota bacterium]
MVYVHLAEGFEEMEALSVVDLLRRVNVEASLVSVTGQRLVKGAHGINIEADILFEEADYEKCGMIVLPGGLPGTFGLRDHEGLCGRIKEFAEAGKKLAAICAAPLVLGELGIVEGRKATIYPGMEANLKGAVPVNEKVVKDGNIITSQGPGAAMYFALAIVEEFCGKAAAEDLRKDLILE